MTIEHQAILLCLPEQKLQFHLQLSRYHDVNIQVRALSPTGTDPTVNLGLMSNNITHIPSIYSTSLQETLHGRHTVLIAFLLLESRISLETTITHFISLISGSFHMLVQLRVFILQIISSLSPLLGGAEAGGAFPNQQAGADSPGVPSAGCLGDGTLPP